MNAKEFLAVLLEGLEEEYSQPREGTHVSDITLCPRKTCYQKIDPVPLTIQQLNFFSSGNAVHDAISRLAMRHPDFEYKKKIQWKNIIGEIDLYYKPDNIPIEAKSMRVGEVLNPKPHHLSQLKAYMAMASADYGILFYQLLHHFKEEPLRVYDITMTESERNETREHLETDAVALERAIHTASPAQARHIAYNTDLNWLCKYCPWEKQCIALRVKERNKHGT